MKFDKTPSWSVSELTDSILVGPHSPQRIPVLQYLILIGNIMFPQGEFPARTKM